jgi:hypothetical protein
MADTSDVKSFDDAEKPLVKRSTRSRTVTIGIQFDRIGEIDTMNEKFYAELTIESQWRENKIIHNYDTNVDWDPKLFIEVTSDAISFLIPDP